jgi:hypothetical protein
MDAAAAATVESYPARLARIASDFNRLVARGRRMAVSKSKSLFVTLPTADRILLGAGHLDRTSREVGIA